MAIRAGAIAARIGWVITTSKTRSANPIMEGGGGGRSWRMPRYFSDDRGRVLSEEERAKENVYIQKMERERLEKLRKKRMEKEKTEADKENINKGTGDHYKG